MWALFRATVPLLSMTPHPSLLSSLPWSLSLSLCLGRGGGLAMANVNHPAQEISTWPTPLQSLATCRRSAERTAFASRRRSPSGSALLHVPCAFPLCSASSLASHARMATCHVPLPPALTGHQPPTPTRVAHPESSLGSSRRVHENSPGDVGEERENRKAEPR